MVPKNSLSNQASQLLSLNMPQPPPKYASNTQTFKR